MSTKHESLAAVFAPTPTKVDTGGDQRGKKLAGLLSPRRPSDAAPQQVLPADGADVTSVVPLSVVVEQSATPAPASETVPTAIRSKGVYLPHDLLGILKVRTRSVNSTYTDILIDAFDVVSDEDLIAKFKPLETSAGLGGGMPRRRRTTDSAKSGTQIQLRLDRAQEAWLTAKENHVGAPSRSALVSIVYEMYFDAVPPKRRSH